MAGGKRASMREGPLAALFRGTAELEAEDKAQREQREASDTAQREATERAERAWREAPSTPEPEEKPAAAEPVVEREAPRVPSPQQRLRAAFSSDIPDNVLAPPAPAPADPYARGGVEPSYDQARAAGPILRVVGVGGAGVNAVNRMIEAEVEGVEFIAINTDLQSLQQSTADITLHI